MSESDGGRAAHLLTHSLTHSLTYSTHTVNDCCFFGSGIGAAHPVDAAVALAEVCVRVYVRMR